MNDKMKQAFDETFRTGETILWEGETQPFRLLAGREGRGALLRWCVGALCVAAGSLVTVLYHTFSPGLFAAMALLYAVIAIAPVLTRAQLLGQRYYLTETRAVTIKTDGTVFTMSREKTDAVRLFPLENGAALALGSSLLEEGDRQLRWRALHPAENPGKFGGFNALGLVFYNVENAERALRLLQIDAEKAGV